MSQLVNDSLEDENVTKHKRKLDDNDLKSKYTHKLQTQTQTQIQTQIQIQIQIQIQPVYCELRQSDFTEDSTYVIVNQSVRTKCSSEYRINCKFSNMNKKEFSYSR